MLDLAARWPPAQEESAATPLTDAGAHYLVDCVAPARFAMLSGAKHMMREVAVPADRNAIVDLAARQAARESAVEHLMDAEGPALVPVPQARSAMLSLAARRARAQALERFAEAGVITAEEP
jgi:uncharacterized protein (DUF2342 family)